MPPSAPFHALVVRCAAVPPAAATILFIRQTCHACKRRLRPALGTRLGRCVCIAITPKSSLSGNFMCSFQLCRPLAICRQLPLKSESSGSMMRFTAKCELLSYVGSSGKSTFSRSHANRSIQVSYHSKSAQFERVPTRKALNRSEWPLEKRSNPRRN